MTQPPLTARYALEVAMILKCGLGLHVDEVNAVNPDLPHYFRLVRLPSLNFPSQPSPS